MNGQGKEGGPNETLSENLSFLFDYNMKYLKCLSPITQKG